MTLQNEHMIVNVNLWTWACEQEWIFLEYFDDVDIILLEYRYAMSEWCKNYFSTCTWMKVTKWMKISDESWNQELLDDNYKLTKKLDETFDRLKCMDGINSKTVMIDETHIYMDESYMRDEILRWMWNMNELLDDNWK